MSKTFKGKVISDKMAKTAVVEVTRACPHPLYRKVLRKKKKFYVHNGKEAKKGDRVLIKEVRPLSKLKRFEVVEILNK